MNILKIKKRRYSKYKYFHDKGNNIYWTKRKYFNLGDRITLDELKNEHCIFLRDGKDLIEKPYIYYSYNSGNTFKKFFNSNLELYTYINVNNIFEKFLK